MIDNNLIQFYLKSLNLQDLSGIDYLLQDDGKGVYIKEWNEKKLGKKPTDKYLLAFQEKCHIEIKRDQLLTALETNYKKVKINYKIKYLKNIITPMIDLKKVIEILNSIKSGNKKFPQYLVNGEAFVLNSQEEAINLYNYIDDFLNLYWNNNYNKLKIEINKCKTIEELEKINLELPEIFLDLDFL